jgi:hypothetical protein
VTATWSSGSNLSRSSWVGLYSASSDLDSRSLTYVYLNGTPGVSGSISLAVPSTAPGGTTYEVRLFSSGYTRAATSNSFVVVALTSTPTATPTRTATATPTSPPAQLSVSPASVTAGGSVTATWSSVANPSPANWIGLYSSSTAFAGSFLTYQYIGSGAAPAGSLSLAIPASAPSGSTYEVRLFSSGYTPLVASNSFSVIALTTTPTATSTQTAAPTATPPPAQVSASPASVLPGGVVTATWSSVSNPSPTNWIGLYRSSTAFDTDYLSYVYIGAAASASGSISLPVPASAPGGTGYELRLFRSAFSRLATSNAFAVPAPTPTPTATASPTATPTASPTATATASPTPTPTPTLAP